MLPYLETGVRAQPETLAAWQALDTRLAERIAFHEANHEETLP